MISSSPDQTRFLRISSSSEPHFTEVLSHFYAPPTDVNSPTTSPTRYQSWDSHDSVPLSFKEREFTYPQASSGNPSPPPTDSHLKNSILPSLLLLDSNQSGLVILCDSACYVGGVLDSPLVMYRQVLKSTIPLSPPLTLPTSTTSLPQVDSGPYPFSPSDDPHDLSDQEDPYDTQSPRFGAFTPSSQSSCSTLQSPPPLSPVSPYGTEWPSGSFPFSAAAPTVFGGVPHPENETDTFPVPLDDPGCKLFQGQSSGKGESESPKHAPLSLLNIQYLDYIDPCRSEYGYPLFSPPIFESPKPICQCLEPIDSEDTGFPPLPFGPSSPDPRAQVEDGEQEQASVHDKHEATPTQHRPESQKETHGPPTVTSATFPHTYSPSTRNSSLPELDDLYDMEVDFPDFPSIPSSPSRRSYSALPDDEDQQDIFPSYPTSNTDTPMDLTESPSTTFLSLPGADTDEDLIPQDLAPTKPAPEDRSLPYTYPLLVIDDDSTPHSSSSPRSPSPEPCTLLDMAHLTPQMQNDDEVRRIYGLLKRAKDKERAAKQMESIVEKEERVARSIAESASGSRTISAWDKLLDARRRTKKMKDKVREVATLLRLKLAQRGWNVVQDASGTLSLVPTSPTPGSAADGLEDEDGMKVDLGEQKPKGGIQKKPRITSPQQLLVKMIIDRHEPKYNPNLRASIPRGDKPKSPLARGSISAGELEVGDGVQSEHESDDIDIPEVEMNDIDGMDLDTDMGMSLFS